MGNALSNAVRGLLNSWDKWLYALASGVLLVIWAYDIVSQMLSWPALAALNPTMRTSVLGATMVVVMLVIGSVLNSIRAADEFGARSKAAADRLGTLAVDIEEKIRGLFSGLIASRAEIERLCDKSDNVTAIGPLNKQVLDLLKQHVAEKGKPLTVIDTCATTSDDTDLLQEIARLQADRTLHVQYYYRPGDLSAHFLLGRHQHDDTLVILFGGLAEEATTFGMTASLRARWRDAVLAGPFPAVRLNLEDKWEAVSSLWHRFSSSCSELAKGVHLHKALAEQGTDKFGEFWNRAPRFLPGSNEVLVSWVFENGGVALAGDAKIAEWLSALSRRAQETPACQVRRYILVSYNDLQKNENKIADKLRDLADRFFPKVSAYEVHYINSDHPLIEPRCGDYLIFRRGSPGDCYQGTDTRAVTTTTQFSFDGVGSDTAQKAEAFFKWIADNLESFKRQGICKQDIGEIVSNGRADAKP